MHWIVPLVLLTGLLAPWLERRWGEKSLLVLAGVPAGTALWVATRQPAIARGEIEAFSAPWVPGLGIEWAFRLDGLSSLLALLVAAIGTLIVIYGTGYLRGHPRLGRFHAFLLVFMAGMLGVASADDVFLLFVFWELTTISSFLLIGFETSKPEARQAATTSLLVTASGGLALLAGLVLLVDAAGTSSLSEIVASGATVRAHPHYGWILALVALGAFTKSAQAPFHFWLPGAMQAPTPVSAYLHSSTMVKAGVFLLARLSPTLGGTEAWSTLLSGVGGATMLLGAAMALGQDDLKRLLAYSTVAVLGLLTLLLGLGTPVAARAFAVTLLAHALYKGTLFLVAGNVDHATGTRSIAALGGLRRAMPWTAAAAAVAGVSMAGAPPLFGFLAKETAYEAALEAPRSAPLFGTATVLTGICLVFAALRAGIQPFFGTRRPGSRPADDPPAALRFAPVALAATGLTAGLLVGPAERLLVAPAAAAVLQEEAPTGLALWHGFTPILALSVFTVAAGLTLFRARARVLERAARLAPLARYGPQRAWEAGWSLGLAGAGRLAHALQNGSLTRYLAITLGVALAGVAWGLWRSGLVLPSAASGTPFSGIALAAVLLVVGGAVGAARAPSPLVAVTALGGVGFGVALLFLVYSAPDLALTQLVVEVLTVVLLVFVLRRLPRSDAPRRRRPRIASLALAGAGGTAMTALTWLASQAKLAPPISGYLVEASVPLAHGRNVVNVILVDFRALDTLGEITVLAVAALGILALLKLRRGADPHDEAEDAR